MEINKELFLESSELGLTNKELSVKFNVSLATIKRYKKNNNIKSKYYDKKHEMIKCLHCEKEFDSFISEERKYCSHSCSASATNVKKTKRKTKTNHKVCKNCLENFISNGSKRLNIFCSSHCCGEYKVKENFTKIENGIHVSSNILKKYLIHKNGDQCMECGWDKVNPVTKKVPVELEHIDGDHRNNTLGNVKLLCPNCHSLTTTYKALNRGKGRPSRRKL
jgi:hypothetical protein